VTVPRSYISRCSGIISSGLANLHPETSGLFPQSPTEEDVAESNYLLGPPKGLHGTIATFSVLSELPSLPSSELPFSISDPESKKVHNSDKILIEFETERRVSYHA